MKVNYYNLTDYNTRNYQTIINKVFKSIDNSNRMQIIFVTPEKIQELNNTYRQKDYITDVLTFPSDESDSLGDVFICIDVAKRQSKEYKHSLSRELGFLSVHGYLHLMGYDHHTKLEEEEMFNLQEQILKNANLLRK